MKINTNQGGDFDPIEEGVWEADITRLYDHVEFNRFDNKDKEGLRFEFTIVEGDMKDRKAYRFLSPSLSPKSILWAVWKAVKKSEPTADELAAIETTENLIEHLGGKPVKIIVKNRTSSKGNVYYTVADFVKSNRTEGEHAFEAGAPEGQPTYNSPAPAAHVSESPAGASMSEVADEVFGGAEQPSTAVPKANPKVNMG